MEDRHKKKLEELDRLIDLDKIRDVQSQIDKALRFKETGECQYYKRCSGGSAWSAYPNTECRDNPEKDLMTTLGVIYGGFMSGLPTFCKVSSELGNWGIIHSLFGGNAVYHENQAKWLEPIAGLSMDDFIARGAPDIRGGIVPKLLERLEYMLEVLSRYENLSRIPVSPIEVFGVHETACALMEPSELIMEMMLNEDKVTTFFDIILEATIQYNLMLEDHFKDEIKSGRVMTFSPWYSEYAEYRLVEDSAILLSPDLYHLFCRKYNEILFDRFAPDGGAVHFCGNGSHLLDEVLATRGLRHFDPGQIELYDFDALYEKLKSAGVGMSFRTEKKDVSLAEIRNYIKRPGLVMSGFAALEDDGTEIKEFLASVRSK